MTPVIGDAFGFLRKIKRAFIQQKTSTTDWIHCGIDTVHLFFLKQIIILPQQF